MSEINKIGIKPVDIQQKTQKAKGEPKVPGQGFEDQLLKTVEELENMPGEIDAAMKELENGQNPGKVTSDVSKVGNYIKSVAGMGENLSSALQNNTKSVKQAVDQYQKMNPKKDG